MDLLNQVTDMLTKFVTIGGGGLLVFGVITVGTNLKDHNGPAISSGVWQIIGGALIIAAAVLFGSISA